MSDAKAPDSQPRRPHGGDQQVLRLVLEERGDMTKHAIDQVLLAVKRIDNVIAVGSHRQDRQRSCRQLVFQRNAGVALIPQPT